MIVLCISLLDCTSTFLQPVILCHAFGSVLLLRYASACFCLFEKSATAYAHTSTVVDFTRYVKSACKHICGHWALKLQNIFTEYKILIKMQQYVCVVVLINISDYVQTVSLDRTAFFFFCCSLHIAERELWLSTPWGGPTVPIITVKQQCEGGILQSQKDVIEVH